MLNNIARSEIIILGPSSNRLAVRILLKGQDCACSSNRWTLGPSRHQCLLQSDGRAILENCLPSSRSDINFTEHGKSNMGDDKGLICQGVFMYREGHTLTVGIGGMHGDRTILYILVENGFTRGIFIFLPSGEL